MSSNAYAKAYTPSPPQPATVGRPSERPNSLGWGLFIVTLILLGAGVVLVYDASYPLAIEFHGNAWFFFKRQCLWAVFGLGGLFLAKAVPYWKWRAVALPGLIVSIVLLLIAHFIGHSAQGAQRWIGYGPVRIQPSEIAKLALVIFVAAVLAARPKLTQNLWRGVVPLLGIALISIILVDKQPDLGTAITMLLTVLVILYAGGARARWLATIVALFVLVSVGMVLHKGTDNYRWKRVTAFVNPDAEARGAAYQIIHSTIALGTGGWTGLGFGESREKNYGGLPAQRTDMIFAITGEEFGLAGTSALIVLYVLLAGYGFSIAQRSRDPFGTLLAIGITSMISVQSLINIGVVTASIPATGVPLPFISYGGSSLAVTLFAVGILLNISEHPFRRPAPKNRRTTGAATPRESYPLTPAPASGRSATMARERLLREHGSESREREGALR